MVVGDTVLGEICHIHAASVDGPRYDPQQSTTERHGYDNLILLCPNHHKVVDDDPEAFTAQRLQKMKLDHATRAAEIPGAEIDHGARLLIDHAVISVAQSGGITAHTLNQTVHVHPPVVERDPGAKRGSMIAILRKFHEDHVSSIAAGEGHVASLDNGTLILHVLPFGLTDGQQVPSFESICTNLDSFPPINGSVRDHKINYDGVLIGSNNEGLRHPQRAYVMMFRSGAVEAVASSLGRGRDARFLILPDLQAVILKYTCLYANALEKVGVRAPLAVFVSLIGVKNRELLQVRIENAFPEDLPSQTLHREVFEFRECVLDSLPIDLQACARALRPILEHLANAAGLSASPNFDAAGNYVDS
jgi:GGDEF domain-containing protein